MAKKAAVNKSQTVRDYLKAHPGTANKEVAEALTKQGIKISANHVANIKSKMAVSTGKRKRRSKAAKAMSAKSGVSVHEIKAAFVFAKGVRRNRTCQKGVGCGPRDSENNVTLGY